MFSKVATGHVNQRLKSYAILLHCTSAEQRRSILKDKFYTQ